MKESDNSQSPKNYSVEAHTTFIYVHPDNIQLKSMDKPLHELDIIDLTSSAMTQLKYSSIVILKDLRDPKRSISTRLKIIKSRY